MSIKNRRSRADDMRVRPSPHHREPSGRTPLRSERGQAMVEFALIAPLFILLVAGIIQFGVALNFWLDMQRIANQGARWAAVNCGPTGGFDPCNPTLDQYLATETISGGLRPRVEVCYPEKNGLSGGMAVPTAGDPVTIELTKAMTLVPIIDVGSLDLRASATMRLEQEPTLSRIPEANGDGNGAC